MMNFENLSREGKLKKEFKSREIINDLDSLLKEMKDIVEAWKYAGSEEGIKDEKVDEQALREREQAVAEAFLKIKIPEERKEEVEKIVAEFSEWADDENAINKIKEHLGF